ncbi:MAG: hypothetical protein KKF89_00055, partial [Nanoarchaeota archaeon]|nr:hypothetical protein [Nanoarchaeota archaeon]
LRAGQVYSLDLNDYVFDVETSDRDIVWSFQGNSAIQVDINSSNIATFTTPSNAVTETITFTADDTDGSASSDNVNVQVIVNNELVLSDIPDLILRAGQVYSLDLNDYVFDVETSDRDIVWSFQGNSAIQVNINSSNIATFTAPAQAVREVVVFTADDTDGSTSSDNVNVQVTVNQPPKWINNISRASLQEDFGMVIHVNDLSNLVSDPDNDTITFSVVQESNSEVDCEVSGDNLLLHSVTDWNGETSCVIRANDGKWVEDVRFSIIVNPVNDAPVMQNILNQRATEGRLFSYQVTCLDVDGDVLTYSDDTALFDISQTGAIAFTPVLADQGVYSITVTCDDGVLFSSDTFTLSVDSVSRAPQVKSEELVAYIGRTFTYKVNATDLNNDLLTFFDDSNLFDIDVNTGVIVFNPNAEHLGRHKFIVTVSDGVFDVETEFPLLVLFYSPSHCSDGLDNDNDGLIDYPADPGCESPDDNNEFSIINNVESGVKIVKIRSFGYDYNTVLAGDYLMLSVTLENVIDEDIEMLTIGAILPEIGIKERLAVVDIDAGDRKTVKAYLHIPADITSGDYYLGVYASTDDLKRTKYVPLRVI